jgi:hypothetical protein
MEILEAAIQGKEYPLNGLCGVMISGHVVPSSKGILTHPIYFWLSVCIR